MKTLPNHISRISVRGFKSIAKEQSLEIRPLTLLAGANSSGKSSFMQPLLLLKQTLEAPVDPGPLFISGENICFTKAEQFLNRDSDRNLSVQINLTDSGFLRLVFQYNEAKEFEVLRMTCKYVNDLFDVRPGMTHEEILKLISPYLHNTHEEIGKKEKHPHKWVVYRLNCFLQFHFASDDEMGQRIQPADGFPPVSEYQSLIRDIIYVPELRGNPLSRNYWKIPIALNFPGRFDSYWASVIFDWQNNQNAEKLDLLTKALEDMELTWKVEAKRVNDTHLEIMVGRLPHRKDNRSKALVNVVDVGFGVSQVLPVLVALIVARPGQLVYLEQPEIHLHPLAQRRLARIIAEAANRGVIAVVETHSAILLREIQTLVATSKLDKKDVAIHWFHRDEEGNTSVSTAELDDNGAYGDWPEDFDNTEIDAEKDYLDAVEKRGVEQ